MQMSSGTTVDLAGHHPIYREVDGQLSLTLHDPTKHYRLRVNLEKGETFYVEFSDEEEAAANRQKAEWEASAPAREAEAKHQAEIAEQFESALYYQNRIVAFLDILGWKAAILSTGQQHMDVVKVLGKTLAALQGVTSHFNSLSALLPEKKKWPGNPVMTQFSDSVVISVDDDRCGRDSLQDALSVLTSNLIQFGFLLRGGITRGELFHDGSLVFGPALIEAYELESKCASGPRIILSKDLSAEWGGMETTGALPWLQSPDGYSFFNFLPPFMGSQFFCDQQLWQSRLLPIRDLILRAAENRTYSESEGVFAKYLWLADYFDRICDEYPHCGMEKVMQAALNSRSRDCE